MSDVQCTERESHLTCDGMRLHCRAVEPTGPIIARVAIIHGYGEHSGRYLHFMRWLAERGVASVTFDQRGHGLSTGRRGFVRKWEEYLTDVQTLLESVESSAAGAPTGGLRVSERSAGEGTGGTSAFGQLHSQAPIGAGPCRPGRTAGPSPMSPGQAFGSTGPTRPGSEGHSQPSVTSTIPLFILGHSHGGLICAAAAERGMLGNDNDAAAQVRGCILTSPYLAARVPPPMAKRLLAGATNHIVPWLRVSSGLQRNWLSSDPDMIAQDHADKLINRTATPRWFFTMRRAQTRVRNEAGSFKLPLLCLAGGADVISDLAATAQFVEQAGSIDKSFYAYPDQLHELLREVRREQVFADIFGWLKARI